MNFRFSETVSTIIPLIAPLSKDTEPVVKQHLVEQLRYIAKVCIEGSNIHFIPCLVFTDK
jgi:hypothetical protein